MTVNLLASDYLMQGKNLIITGPILPSGQPEAFENG
jgi:hypothetical protein